LLGCGAVGGPLFVAAFTIEGAARPAYDPMREPVSALALGNRGWTQSTNFIGTGLLMLALSAGLRFAADPSGFARMLSDVLLDGLVIHPEG
jgi:hypothetical protein